MLLKNLSVPDHPGRPVTTQLSADVDLPWRGEEQPSRRGRPTTGAVKGGQRGTGTSKVKKQPATPHVKKEALKSSMHSAAKKDGKELFRDSVDRGGPVILPEGSKRNVRLKRERASAPAFPEQDTDLSDDENDPHGSNPLRRREGLQAQQQVTHPPLRRPAQQQLHSICGQSDPPASRQSK